jgi:hypothetical protein
LTKKHQRIEIAEITSLRNVVECTLEEFPELLRKKAYSILVIN